MTLLEFLRVKLGKLEKKLEDLSLRKTTLLGELRARANETFCQVPIEDVVRRIKEAEILQEPGLSLEDIGWRNLLESYLKKYEEKSETEKAKKRLGDYRRLKEYLKNAQMNEDVRDGEGIGDDVKDEIKDALIEGIFQIYNHKGLPPGSFEQTETLDPFLGAMERILCPPSKGLKSQSKDEFGKIFKDALKRFEENKLKDWKIFFELQTLTDFKKLETFKKNQKGQNYIKEGMTRAVQLLYQKERKRLERFLQEYADKWEARLGKQERRPARR